MDIILLKDVERLGKTGSTVKVKPGFARNFLMPRGLAAEATPENLRIVEERKRQSSRKLELLRKQFEGQKQRIEKRTLTFSLSVGENDAPFGSVTAHEIVEALAKDGITIEKSMLQLEEPIKALGQFQVPVRFHPEITATLKLTVVKA